MMHFTSSLLTTALMGVALAQTPPGFTPQVQNTLDLGFPSTTVTTAGVLLAKSAVAPQPKIALPNSIVQPNITYLFVVVDTDVVYPPGSTTKRVFLQCMNTGFMASTQMLVPNATTLTSATQGPATYISPIPPSNDTSPHHYIELLFQQPASFNSQSFNYTTELSRLDFNITSFMAQNGLSAPVAGNYFLVNGSANANATSTASASTSATRPKSTSSVPPFTGAAGKMKVGLGLVGVVCALVLLSI